VATTVKQRYPLGYLLERIKKNKLGKLTEEEQLSLIDQVKHLTSKMVYGFLPSFRGQEEAEDLFQYVIMRLLERAKKYDSSKASASRWVILIAYTQILRKLDKANRQKRSNQRDKDGKRKPVRDWNLSELPREPVSCYRGCSAPNFLGMPEHLRLDDPRLHSIVIERLKDREVDAAIMAYCILCIPTVIFGTKMLRDTGKIVRDLSRFLCVSKNEVKRLMNQHVKPVLEDALYEGV